MNIKTNSISKTLSNLISKSKTREPRQDLHVDVQEKELKPKLDSKFLSQDSLSSPLDPNRPSVAGTLIETSEIDQFPQSEYEYALEIIKNHRANREKKTLKQRLTGLRSAVKITAARKDASPPPQRMDIVNEYVPSVNERVQIHLQEEFEREVNTAQNNIEPVREEELVVHQLGEASNPFFRSENGLRVIDLIRSKPKDWVKGLSQKTLDSGDQKSIYFNKSFVKRMKTMGLGSFDGTKFNAISYHSPDPAAGAKAEKVGIHINDLITKIKSDTAFKQEIIQNKYPNQLVYKSLFGDLTEETEQYFVVPEYEDGYETEEGVASDVASVHVKIVDGDSSSSYSSEKEHPLEREFYPAEYQEIERNTIAFHKRGVSEGHKNDNLSLGARQLLKLNSILDGTKPILAPSQLQQLHHVLVDEDGAIRVRRAHSRHKSSPTDFSPNDLKSVVSYLFPPTSKDAILIDGITAKAMEDFSFDPPQ